MESMGRSRWFVDLKAWQKARAFRKAISSLAKGFPVEEKFRLADQIIRSSRGPSANIAEGYGRFHEKDNARFCRMASGSLNETLDHLTVAVDEGYISTEEFRAHWNQGEEALRVLHGYIRYLRKIDAESGMVSDPAASYGDEGEDDIFTDPPVDLIF
ncbi:MAG: four helix bundle protein [Flavobacteriia bacterium]|nr:four helix bundle protein [Flavobacteriia bacterium]